MKKSKKFIVASLAAALIMTPNIKSYALASSNSNAKELNSRAQANVSTFEGISRIYVKNGDLFIEFSDSYSCDSNFKKDIQLRESEVDYERKK